LKPNSDEPLSNFALNFNLRRFSKAVLFKKFAGIDAVDLVGRCRFTVSNPVLKAPMVSALETII